jgi:hypothetical protein
MVETRLLFNLYLPVLLFEAKMESHKNKNETKSKFDLILHPGGDRGGLNSIYPKYFEPIETETGAGSRIQRMIILK